MNDKYVRSKMDIAREYIRGIEANYPEFCGTFGDCPAETCSNSGRGGGKCAECYELKLGEIVGDVLAKEYHLAVRAKGDIFNRIQKKCRINNG